MVVFDVKMGDFWVKMSKIGSHVTELQGRILMEKCHF